MSEENLRAPGHEEWQEEIELNGEKVWVDPEIGPLLKELNKVGLITRSHCCGHGDNPAWIAIRKDNILGIEIRDNESYNEVLITWRPVNKFKQRSK